MMRKKYDQMRRQMLYRLDSIRYRLCLGMQELKEHANEGVGVIEIILILVVLIGLVIIFKSQLTTLINSIFEKITSESSGI